jgi:predicted  nucleic acid-binding Zn-ribbon protein
MQIERSKNELNDVNDDIAKARKLLSEINISCKDKRQELENISSEILRIINFC